MYKNLSPQTKSFIILFCVAIVGTYLAVMLQRDQQPQRAASRGNTAYIKPDGSVASASDVFMPNFKPVDTSGWKTYTDESYNFSFKYEPTWKVKTPKQQDGYYILEIDPGSKYYNMKIYASKTGFYGVDGLPSVETDINGVPARNVSNLLYGIKSGPNYFTFENGLSTAMIDNFNAWVRTVQFK